MINFNNNLPKLSIVTPSFNQGDFLEQTIKSVLSQNYPNLEYIIMDGGSTDNSIEIIEKYSSHLSFWKSMPDKGQSAAIREGFQRATGDIFAYINSDDYYLKDSFSNIIKIFHKYPNIQWVTGQGIVVNENNIFQYKYKKPKITINNMVYLCNCVFQPATFWRKELYMMVGGINSNYSFSFDYDLFLHFLEHTPPILVNKEISAFRIHNKSKTMNILYNVGMKEAKVIRQEFFQRNKINKNWMLEKFGEIYRENSIIEYCYNFII